MIGHDGVFDSNWVDVRGIKFSDEELIMIAARK